MEKIVERGILYDFYGELLTDHQKAIYEEAVFDDMSLSEIAEQHGVSRQAAHDILKRCDKILADYEDKLHLVEKFMKIKATAAKMQVLLEDAQKLQDVTCMREKCNEIFILSNEMIEEL